MANGENYYCAYGLNIESDFVLPELLTLDSKSEINLQIKQGIVSLPEMKLTSIKRQGIAVSFGGTEQKAYLHWSGIGSFLAQSGHTLMVQPATQKLDSQLLNLFLLSEALGLILYQQGYILLHGSAVKIKDKVIIFAGAPGAGKSTMAAAFAKLGYAVLADDLVAMKLTSEGQILVYPGFPQIKIWSPTVQGLNIQSDALAPLFTGSEKSRLRPRNFPLKPLPLAHCFVIVSSQQYQLYSLQGQKALMSLFRFFPCPGELLQGQGFDHYQQKCLQLTKTIPMWILARPNNFGILDQFVNWLIQQISPNQ